MYEHKCMQKSVSVSVRKSALVDLRDQVCVWAGEGPCPTQSALVAIQEKSIKHFLKYKITVKNVFGLLF